MVGQFFQLVERLKSFADTKVAGRQHIGAIEREDEEHVYGPHADAFDLREMYDEVRRFHFVERTVSDSAVGEFLREVFDIRSLLAGKARRAHFLKRYRPHRRGSGERASREEGEKTRVYRLRRRARNLLVNNRTHECRERIFAPFQIGHPVLFDKRREALVALENPDGIGEIRLFPHGTTSYYRRPDLFSSTSCKNAT